MDDLQENLLRILLYYDIWQYPLTEEELFAFLPVNSMTQSAFVSRISVLRDEAPLRRHRGYYFVRGRTPAVVTERTIKEQNAGKLWRAARISAAVIRRFPFVRGVFVSGDLSKYATTDASDVDFFIFTETDRMWIARALLTLFKKVFLLNSKKYFCLNSFRTADNLYIREHNIFQATELAHLKPLHNAALFNQFIGSNNWIKSFFPNFQMSLMRMPGATDGRSILQRALEAIIELLPLTHLDRWIERKMSSVWARRYPHFDESTREKLFRCTRKESRAYAGDFESKILESYSSRLREFGIKP